MMTENRGGCNRKNKREHLGLAGVYIVVNTATGFVYVGSTVSLSDRWNDHSGQLKRGVHHNEKMAEDFERYGIGSFKVYSIEPCDRSRFKELEQFYLDLFDKVGVPLYNICKFAYSAKGLKIRCSDEKRKRMSIARLGVAIPWKKEIKKGERYKERTLPVCAGNHVKKAVIQMTLSGETERVFGSVCEAQRETGAFKSAIIKCCKGKQNSSLGFKWRYVA